MQRAAPFRSCNFFIGTNNSGKSCFLNFISKHLLFINSARRDQSNALPLDPLEVHLGATPAQVSVGLAFASDYVASFSDQLIRHESSWGRAKVLKNYSKLIRSLAVENLIWVSYQGTDVCNAQFEIGDSDQLVHLLEINEWRELWQGMTGNTGGDLIQHWVPEVIKRILNKLKAPYPSAAIIPAKRQIGAKGHDFQDYSGSGLIDRLAELQNPRATERHLRGDFERINNFLRDVTADESAMIEIPHDRDEVLVHKDGRVLPLSSLGTGIHEVVMIAAFCTIAKDGIVCIEEPEIHLHPLLQKKLINYISKNTTNQYFIATHSASIIDEDGAAIFHVTHEDSSTQVSLVADSSHRFRVCVDLGYRASDLLQTNAVIWVEGPSDRVYLKHWISSINSLLVEGIHYSIMFYGGRLLSHLGADDSEISEFIDLRRLNRNMAIVIDSDRHNRGARINATKRRIEQEFIKSGDIAWITAGREIENYVSQMVLDKAMKSVYPSFSKAKELDRYAHRLPFFESGSGRLREQVDKVKVARAVCRQAADLTMYDLEKRMKELVSMIVKANS